MPCKIKTCVNNFSATLYIAEISALGCREEEKSKKKLPVAVKEYLPKEVPFQMGSKER